MSFFFQNLPSEDTIFNQNSFTKKFSIDAKLKKNLFVYSENGSDCEGNLLTLSVIFYQLQKREHVKIRRFPYTLLVIYSKTLLQCNLNQIDIQF